MPARTFVVTVSEPPSRVVVEDVRCRRRAVAADLAAVGGEIALLIETPPDGDDPPRGDEPLRPEEAGP